MLYAIRICSVFPLWMESKALFIREKMHLILFSPMYCEGIIFIGSDDIFRKKLQYLVLVHCSSEIKASQKWRQCLKSLSLYLYIYIYTHPQTDCFVVLQLFRVVRLARCFKLGSKPSWFYFNRASYSSVIVISTEEFFFQFISFTCVDNRWNDFYGFEHI